MATDNTQSPSDAEIGALFLQETGFDTNDCPAAIHDFARAVLARWGAQATVGEPVAWGIFDSQGFYESAHDEESAARFCAYYNKRRGADPRRPYTSQALVPRAAPPTPSPEMPDLTALTERGKEVLGEGRVPEDTVRWCGNCGEGVTFFCRSKTVGECSMKLGRITAHGITAHSITSKEGGPNAE